MPLPLLAAGAAAAVGLLVGAFAVCRRRRAPARSKWASGTPRAMRPVGKQFGTAEEMVHWHAERAQRAGQGMQFATAEQMLRWHAERAERERPAAPPPRQTVIWGSVEEMIEWHSNQGKGSPGSAASRLSGLRRQVSLALSYEMVDATGSKGDADSGGSTLAEGGVVRHDDFVASADGWTMVLDPSSGRHYWWHEQSGRSQWDSPRVQPASLEPSYRKAAQSSRHSLMTTNV